MTTITQELNIVESRLTTAAPEIIELLETQLAFIGGGIGDTAV
jgi:hypothetical protein